MHRYKDLNIWIKSVDLSAKIYDVTESFPENEKYGLASQIRRAAVSIPSNIAEGAGRGGYKSFNNFLSIAVGSLFELDTQLIIANKVNILSKDDLIKLQSEIEHLSNMIFKFKSTLNLNT
ncbi:four helix bundle protein [Marivirga atlantica]|jgi:four helix bundle protein|uniref:Four helix bundle protein n=1 Tax=Marivirga atlantica TaxID=1548457 RepID=A0A937ABP4_9BACT|nr:four helix bundle protein [Marivirga atlantica]MBL0763681.1 four helix bundle protein [Marivirga atlantica]